MPTQEKQHNELIDRIGICASSLCLIHCAITALIILGMPFFSFLDHHIIHELFAITVISTVLIAVYPHCKKHGHKDIIALAIMGIIFVLLGVFLESLTENLTHILTSLGSILLISAHYRNIKVRHGKCTH